MNRITSDEFKPKQDKLASGNTDKIKELEQEKIFLKEFNQTANSKASELEQSKRELEKKLADESKKSRELEQEKIILKELSDTSENMVRKLQKKHYVSIAVIAIAVAGGFASYSYYENQVVINTTSHLLSNYNSNYVIQNLRGDTVNTWVAWNIETGRVLHVNILNDANLPQDKIDAIKDAILSTKTITLDDSLLGKGPKGTSSVYYEGWQGALAKAYSTPTVSFVPQKFDINGLPNGPGDIVIILTNDVSPEGLSGITKSIADGNEILKSKIMIYGASDLSAVQLKAITRHEFGHAMGLAHSTATEDLMHATIQTAYPYISECDISAVKALYDGQKTSQVVCQT